VQTHWYYERARGQYLNDQASVTSGKRDQFLRLNPRNQVITKTDLAKVESCFNLLPDIACKGAEKAFVEFAERVTEEWEDESKRGFYGDDWYRSAVARTILFRATEALVSKAPWYEGGYRAQIVAYAAARLSALAEQASKGGRLDYLKIWSAQTAGEVLGLQLLSIAKVMADVLRSPPLAGQNISEWAKQLACAKRALATEVPIVSHFHDYLIAKDDARAAERGDRDSRRVEDDLLAVNVVLEMGSAYWTRLSAFARERRLVGVEDSAALTIACKIPKKIPAGWQASRLLAVKRRCEDAGFSSVLET
jgi:hypothetical protein